MKICTVIGNVWATKKESSLEGIKLMIVADENADGGVRAADAFVAADLVGAGIGERVLVVSGSTARFATKKDDSVVDAAIVGIVDATEEGNA
jgi:ethanolamine utilization protein EutN